MTTTTSAADSPSISRFHMDVGFTPNPLSRKATLGAMTAAVLAGGFLTLIAWLILKSTSLPAFGGSLVSRSLATFSIVIVVVITGILLSALVNDQRTERAIPAWRRALTYAVSYLSPAGLVIGALAIPLSATKLYLDGVAVDQGFRTQYLTRLTQTWHLSDMNYADLPAFYPAGWFWLGGRFANIMHLSGWEAFQPWALVSLAGASCMLVPVWQRISGSLAVATAIALVSTAIALVMSAQEPYAAIIALGAPAAAIITYRALMGSSFAIVGLSVYLGISASSYTLFTATIALSIVFLSGILAAFFERSWKPILSVIIIGCGSMLIAASVWAPYLLALLKGEHTSGATATHYLPIEGTQIPLPMLAASVVGILCFIGVLYLIVNFREPSVRALGLSLIIFYGWILASMSTTLAGSTLLGFRLDIVVTLILAVAGVLGLADLRLVGIHRLYPERFSPRVSRTITIALTVILMCAGIKYAQEIPNRNAHAIDLAYTETDGNGERADRYPADSGQYFAELDQEIRSHGYTPENAIVLTSENDFLSYYPYYGFQAFTSHYANPLGEFDQRNKLIEQWAEQTWDELKEPQAFLDALGRSPWRAPDVFIFRGHKDDSEGWTYNLAEDIYPNNPNVRLRGIKFNPASFDSSEFSITEIGPFVVVTRVH
ncbi:hypothetical protein EML15_04150 [Corynebacterium sp. sy017]|uniref:galactan 5-O-arabinofuranosyltransferase n=1 Tax=unclassified Corynebacterium TaxID=2624378 RepID=UPI0011850BCC|nr:MULTISPECIES: galactan 5-O-arabinofuranosyltransferase [unclassified Corynebacterium]MBP3088339.1 hypothetical protein [Corynebacterium sp. sy017]TSD91658.1 hypothetical protein ELY17_04150 [Corynebacterium sp. SY003]